MDDNCGEWMECMGVASKRRVWLVVVGGIYGCGKQEVGVASECGCKEVYRFLHNTYLVFALLKQHPYFLFINFFLPFL